MIGGKDIIFGILVVTLAVVMITDYVDGFADTINDSLGMTRQQAAKCIFHAGWRSYKN